MGSISNISIVIFRDYLRSLGLKCDRPKGGHEVWSKEGMQRPVVFQTHIDPIPEFIIKNNLRNIGKTRKEFEVFLKNTGNDPLRCE